jgi:hypothetical protein
MPHGPPWHHPGCADGQWLTRRQIGELHHISKASAKRLAWASRPFVARVQRCGTNDTAKDIAKGIVFLASDVARANPHHVSWPGGTWLDVPAADFVRGADSRRSQPFPSTLQGAAASARSPLRKPAKTN